MSAKNAASQAQEELAAFLDDVVELARSSAGLDHDRLEELKQTFRERVGHLQSEARQTARDLVDQADDALDRADTLAREKPWHFVLAAGLVGLAVGVLVARR
jgi:ElaB/YqjD/DUF883 family membrane-anchored ribosome-binding protein